MHSTSKTLSQTLSKTLSADCVHCVHAVHSRLPSTTSHDTTRRYRTASCKNPTPKWEKPGNPIAIQQLLLGKQVGILWERLGNSREKPGNWRTARSPWSRPAWSATTNLSPYKHLEKLRHFKISAQNPWPFQTFQGHPSKTPAISTKRHAIFSSPTAHLRFL
jgi:hypothetical protein